MAQPPRTSKSAKRAGIRATKLESIDPVLDLGNGNTLAAFNAKITDVGKKNGTYNTEKAKVDGLLDVLEGLEKDLDTMSVNMLSAVRIKYGADSAEYEMAGGTRTSERKKVVRKKKTP